MPEEERRAVPGVVLAVARRIALVVVVARRIGFLVAAVNTLRAFGVELVLIDYDLRN